MSMKLYNPEQIAQIVDNYIFADPKPSGKLIDYINEQTEVKAWMEVEDEPHMKNYLTS